ncbi:MAG: delta-60 repeat domain-containing protein, partial [Verrucomicrobiota bacterium]
NGLVVLESNDENSGFGNLDADRWLNLEEFLLNTNPILAEALPQIPPISLLDEAGDEVGNPFSHDFGTVLLGNQTMFTFQLRNNSARSISFPLFDLTGDNENELTLSDEATVMSGRETIPITVTFDALVAEEKAMTLSIAGSASDPDPYVINFTAIVPPRPQGWDRDWIDDLTGEEVRAMCLQVDGKLLVGGVGLAVNGQSDRLLVRLNRDGTTDASFDCPLVAADSTHDEVATIGIREDGTILVGGRFRLPGDENYYSLMLLDNSGTPISQFGPDFEALSGRASVKTLSILRDGSVLAGGFFTTVGTDSINSIALFSKDGVLDSTFSVSFNKIGGGITKIVRDWQDRILIGGTFSDVGGVEHKRIARLMSDGTLDQGFLASLDDDLLAMEVLPGDAVAVGGAFRNTNGTTPAFYAALSNTGTTQSITLPVVNFNVTSMAFEPGGRRFLGGDFVSLGGNTQRFLAALNNDWTFDSSLPGNFTFFQVNQMVLCGDGTAVVASGTGTNCRLSSAWIGIPAQSLSLDSSGTMQWFRGAGHPLTRQVTFDFSVDQGQNWVNLPDPTYTNGQWQTAASEVPDWSMLRARARVENGSSMIYQTLAGGSDGYTAIERWRLENYGTSANEGVSADGADPSRSGVPNFLRFAVGADVGRIETPLLSVAIDGESVFLSFRQSKVALWSGVDFAVQRCTDLNHGDWQELDNGIVTITPGPIELVEIEVIEDTQFPIFYRLRVTGPNGEG